MQLSKAWVLAIKSHDRAHVYAHGHTSPSTRSVVAEPFLLRSYDTQGETNAGCEHDVVAAHVAVCAAHGHDNLDEKLPCLGGRGHVDDPSPFGVATLL